MFKRMIPVIFLAALGLVPACAQDKPAIVVHAFTLASGVKFPYDMNELQTRAIAMLKDKDGTLFDANSRRSHRPGPRLHSRRRSPGVA